MVGRLIVLAVAVLCPARGGPLREVFIDRSTLLPQA